MADNKELRCVLVSNRPWHKGLPLELMRRTGASFVLINNVDELTVEKLRLLEPLYIFFLHWSHRIPSAIYTEFECVIFHMTDLPFGRGGSPLQNLIAKGFVETKITALRCVEELDAGPVYLKMPLSLYGSAEEIFIRASAIMGNMVVEILQKRMVPKRQEGQVTTFKRRTPEDGDLGLAKSLDDAYDLIRMLDAAGYPNAFVRVGALQLEFSRVARRDGHLVADVRIMLIENSQS